MARHAARSPCWAQSSAAPTVGQHRRFVELRLGISTVVGGAPKFLARLAEEDRARRQWVAETLGDFDADDPRASCGWHRAAAIFISERRAREAAAEGDEPCSH